MPKDTKKKMVVVEEVVPEVEVMKPESVEPQSIVEEKATLPVEPVEKVDPNEDSSQNTNYLFIIVPIALLVGALVGGLITYFSGLSKIDSISKPPVPTSTPVVEVESPSPSASPISLIKKDELKIQILNGSGVSGAASKVKTLLTGAGYKNIDTGNATVSDLEQTEISIKESKKDYLDVLIKDLSKSHDAIEAKKPLSSSSKYDLIITLGEK